MMSRFLQCLLICFLLFLSPPQGAGAAPAQQPANVLILHSYHYELQWTENIQHGIESALAKSGRPVVIQTEFMDARRFESKKYNEMLADLYEAKFRSRRFDTVIVSDNNALEFMLQYRSRLFPGVPVVFCGINDFQDSMLGGAADITGVVETLNFQDTLSIALKLHPRVKNIYVFGDNSLSYHAILRDLLAVSYRFNDQAAFRFYDSATLESAAETIAKLGPDSLVLAVSALRGRDSGFVSFERTVEVLAESGSVPVYGMWDFFLGHGMVGGKVVSGFSQGEAAGGLAVRILGGEPPARVPIIRNSPTSYMFDFHQLQRFSISRQQLPPDAVVVNEPPSAYTIDKSVVMAGFALLLLLLGLAAGAFLLARRWRQINRRLNQENEYFSSLHEVSLGLMNRLQLEGLLETIVNKAAEMVDARHGFVFLVNDKEKVMEMSVGTGLYAGAVGYTLRYGESYSGKVWQTGQPLFENDYAHSPLRSRHPMFAEVKASLHVPLKRGDEVIGVIGLACMEAGRRFSGRELAEVNRFAELASIAIDNARLYEQVQEELRERKIYEKKLHYIGSHDAMTGLLNRRSLEEELQRLDRRTSGSVGILVCDVDGLKLLNDTFGHSEGDRLLLTVSEILRESVPEPGLLFRAGGDEFVAILQEAGREDMEAVYRRIQRQMQSRNESDPSRLISLSVGYAVSPGPEVLLQQAYKQADNNMYREKLHRGQSARSAMVQTVMQMLSERDFITEEHADRLQDWVEVLAGKAGIPEAQYSDLRLFAQFHDIGKVGIADSILKKPGPLTAEEMEAMKRHSEIGHRIAQSSPELLPIADWILKHQERWDGKGYPLGLSGTAIPLECRILALIDAYDAMTSDRPYRRAMTHGQAVRELQRGAGTQFDPHLTELFLDFLEAAGIEKNAAEI